MHEKCDGGSELPVQILTAAELLPRGRELDKGERRALILTHVLYDAAGSLPVTQGKQEHEVRI